MEIDRQLKQPHEEGKTYATAEEAIVAIHGIPLEAAVAALKNEGSIVDWEVKEGDVTTQARDSLSTDPQKKGLIDRIKNIIPRRQ